MAKRNQTTNLLKKLAMGIYDGTVGKDLTTSGGSTVSKIIKNGIPTMIKEGPTRRFFNGKENEKIAGKITILREWKTDAEKLEFLQKFGWLTPNEELKNYSSKFKPKK